MKRRSLFLLCRVFCALGIWTILSTLYTSSTYAQNTLRLEVLKADAQTQPPTEYGIIVQVQNDAGPVGGAQVTFSIIGDNAGGSFKENGGRVLRKLTDPNGGDASAILLPNLEPGA